MGIMTIAAAKLTAVRKHDCRQFVGVVDQSGGLKASDEHKGQNGVYGMYDLSS